MQNDLFLKRVELSNFRVYGEEFNITLPGGPGVTLISGANGMGKTTFFDALEWGLTGEIKRFSPYLGKRANAEHLTRLGAEQDSHRVSLYFTEGNPIDRTAHYGSSVKDIVAQLKTPSWPEINDLYSYLSITHFLGQSSEQRFSLKSPRDQWQALRGPAGVDRLNWAKERVGSQSTRMAFTRAIKESTTALERANEELAQWQALVARRNTTRKLAPIQPADPQETVTHLQRIDEEVQHLLDVSATRPAGSLDVASRVAQSRENLFETIELFRRKHNSLIELESVPREVKRLNGALVSIGERLGASEHARIACETGIADLRDAAHKLERELSQGQEDLRQLKSEQTAWSAIESSTKAIQEASARIAELREQLEALDRTIAVQMSDRERILAETARRTSALRRKLSLSQEMDTLASSVATINQLVEAVADLSSFNSENEHLASMEDLERELAALSADLERDEIVLANLRAEVALVQDREEAIARAVAVIAANLTAADTECPVCQTHFAPEQLVQLARAARASSTAVLSSLSKKVQFQEERRASGRAALLQLRQKQQQAVRVHDTVAKKRMRIRELEKAALDVSFSKTNASEMLNSLLSRQGVIAEELRHLDRDILSMVDIEDLDSRLIGLDASLTAKQTRRAQLVLELGQLQTRQESAQRAFTLHTKQLGSQGADPTSWRDQLAKSFDLINSRVETLGLLSHQLMNVHAELNGKKEELDQLNITYSLELEAQKYALVSIQQLNERWTDNGLQLPPERLAIQERQAHLAAQRSELEASLSKLNLISERYKSWLEDRDMQALSDAVNARVRSAGVNDVTGVELHLMQNVEEANDRLTRTLEVRTLADDIVHTLQTKADQYAHQVLKPLNTCIRQFSRALMTRADDSVSYRAEHHANRSELKPEIRITNGPGKVTSLEMNPNLYFSEGQLAALSVSALLAASTCFRWSRWNALLLDDPLQHSDIIHSSAFADVIVNLVKQLNYQVVISTHDSAETSYLAKRFESASVPLSLCQLRVKGVVGPSGAYVGHD